MMDMQQAFGQRPMGGPAGAGGGMPGAGMMERPKAPVFDLRALLAQIFGPQGAAAIMPQATPGGAPGRPNPLAMLQGMMGGGGQNPLQSMLGRLQGGLPQMGQAMGQMGGQAPTMPGQPPMPQAMPPAAAPAPPAAAPPIPQNPMGGGA